MASTELTVIAPEKKHIKSKRGMKQRWHAIYNEVTDLLTYITPCENAMFLIVFTRISTNKERRSELSRM